MEASPKQRAAAEREPLPRPGSFFTLKGNRVSLPSVTRRERGDHVPLSFAQQRLWFLAQMEGGSEAYHIPLGLRLTGSLDGDVLRRALDRIVARHEALRASFPSVDGEPVQRIAAARDSTFLLLDHDLREHQDAQAELTRLIEQESRSSFDLEAGPLIRGRLIRQTELEYTLLLNMHHIISDGWSTGVFLNELSTLYGAYLRDEDDPLPELTVQYADYAAWQWKWMEGDIQREQAAYWKTALAGVPGLLDLPADHPRPVQQDYAGDFLALVLEGELKDGLKELSRRHGTTLYMTLLAGWAALLARLSGQQDVVVGTPVANRGRVETRNLIGFFVNTVVLRLDVSGGLTVRELLQRVKEQALAAQQHQDIPFGQVVELTQPVRSLAHNPLFQVMFAWQNTPGGKLIFPGLEAKPLEWEAYRVAKFDLTLALQDAGERIVGGLEYATALFERSTVERYAGYFRGLLEGMVADAGQAVAALSLLPEAERDQVLYEWNDTGTEYASEQCVQELFEEQVEKAPAATVLVFEEAAVTYGDLNRRANRLAHALRGLGVEADARVAICVERGVEMVVALLGVLKAGGAYVPLDPGYPGERLQFMLQDSAPVVVLTQSHLRQRLLGLSEAVPVLDLASLEASGQDWPDTNPDRAHLGLTPEHLAYVIYTSGSTGVPKGVQVTHGAVVNFLHAMREEPGLSADDVLLAVTTLSFDIAGLELYLPLSVGARVVLASREEASDPMVLAQKLERHQVTVMQATPATWRLLTAAGWTGRKGMRILCGGEALPRALAQELLERSAGVWNLFGPTETTIWSTAHRVSPGSGPVPIGRPIANTTLYVLDGELEPVPIGVPGELYIGGAGLARGYRGRADLTAERFIPDPFGGEAGGRLYRTGDQARYRADGTLEFLGRNDFQVKIRGFRIELGEIEAVLQQHPAIDQSVVSAWGQGPDEKELVAYLVKRRSVEPRELRTFLRQHLPEYMVPGTFVDMEQMPITSNGKLDRKKLPPPAAMVAAKGENFLAGRTPTEQRLLEIWSRLLKVNHIGVYDSFFDLGGHSLLALRLLVEVQETFEIQLPLSSLFTPPTVAGLAEKVEMALTGNPAEESDAPPDLDVEATLDPTIIPRLTPSAATPPSYVLLTGATGFIGSFLLSEFLHRTHAHIYCLVRAPNSREGTLRLQRQMETLNLWQPDLENRITVVCGDLSTRRLGLSVPEYDEIAEMSDAIYHAGAMVSFFYPYRVLKGANVVGTEEILRLACHKKQKPVHYVSTMSVFPQSSILPPSGEHEWIMKEEGVPTWRGLDLGYTQSKWVAERLVRAAGSRGVPVSIYRPTVTYGQAETGEGNSRDFLYRLIYSCGQLGFAPNVDWNLNLVPVDFVARGILELSMNSESIGRVFHLANEQPNSMRDVIDCIVSSGLPIEKVPYEDWRRRLLQAPPDNALAALAGGLPHNSPHTHPGIEFRCDNASLVLRPKGITCPEVKGATLQKYVTKVLEAAMHPAGKVNASI